MTSSRRTFLQTAAGASSVALGTAAATAATHPTAQQATADFTFCLNMRTIREQTKDVI